MRTVRLSGTYQSDVPLILPSYTRLILDGSIYALPYKLGWTPGSAGEPNMTAAMVSVSDAVMVSVEGGSWSCAKWNASVAQGNTSDVTAIYFESTSFSFIRNLNIRGCGGYAGGPETYNYTAKKYTGGNSSAGIGIGRSGYASGNIRVSGGQSNVIENVESSYSSNRGIWAQTQKLVISGGSYHHNDADGIDLDSGSSHNIIHNVTAFMNSRMGIFMEFSSGYNHVIDSNLGGNHDFGVTTGSAQWGPTFNVLIGNRFGPSTYPAGCPMAERPCPSYCPVPKIFPCHYTDDASYEASPHGFGVAGTSGSIAVLNNLAGSSSGVLNERVVDCLVALNFNGTIDNSGCAKRPPNLNSSVFSWNPDANIPKRRLSLKTTDWRMLDAATPYPNHYVTKKMSAAESASMVIDGKLDEPAWADTEWTYDIVDITRHKNQQLNAIPNDLQCRVKFRWDDDYFYVGAVLHESYVTAQNVGHNFHAPYSPDNDFEIFIDVSGTSQYYMEYEMSAQNATYDIKWGVPDCTQGLVCDRTAGDSWPALPTCYNTSFQQTAPGHGNTQSGWTMATKLHPGDMTKNGPRSAVMNASLTNASRGGTAWPVAAEDTGMVTATAWVPTDYERPTFPYTQWSAEVRFPIRQTPNYWTQGGGYPTSHGGLIDSDPVRQPIWNQYDPALGDAGPGRPRYWWVNFARAEHPRNYSYADGTSDVCPKNCTAKIETAVNVTTHFSPNRGCTHSECPTILGGYWEWVWGPVGDADPGVGYMHRPGAFPLVQFANESGEALCRNIEWPGRHVAKSLHLAQLEYWSLSYTNPALRNGSYAADVSTLLNSTLCNLDLHTSDTCDLDALQYASAHPEVFKLGMDMKTNWTDRKITRACPTQPCYMASVQVTVPATYGAASVGAHEEQTAAYVYTCTINNNRDTVVHHATPAATAPCL